jgi:protein TIF31
MADTPSNNAAAPTNNPESEVPAVQDTPTEDPAETHPTEEDAEQPDDAPFLVKIVLPHDAQPLELPVC